MGDFFPQNLLLPMGDLKSHLTHDSLGLSEPTTQRASRPVLRFCTDDRRVSLYFTMGRPFLPVKIAPSHGGSGPPSNTWFPGPTQVLNPNGISIGSGVFAGLTSVTDRRTDRQTDRPCYTRSVTIDRIYILYVVRAMRTNNNKWSR